MRRAEYVIGNYLGLVLALALFVAANAAFLSLAVVLATGEIDLKPLFGAAMVLIELTTLAAIALLYSSFAGPLVAAFLIAATYVAGHLVSDLHDLAVAAHAPAFAWASYALPNLASFDVRPEVVHGFALDPGRLCLAVAHGVSYAACALTMAVLVFERRELR
jgi:hypothetical protein